MSAKKRWMIPLIVILILAIAVVPVLAKGNGKGHGRKAGNALPDQDGRGMDRGLPASDKVADGGDWDNGCGNESDPTDREDDNNGRCGGDHKSTATPTPVVTVTPVVTATPTETPTITICWYGETPEVWDEEWKFLDESLVMVENHGEVCWTAEAGRTYYILDWSPESGHSGPMYSLTVPLDTPVGVHYPQRGGLFYPSLLLSE